MSNPYFQFRQFTIYQDRCAQKVCTDACILGAWFAGKLSPGSRVLDIGSGTGLLMLLMAQQQKGEIHGIELDPDAFMQGRENISKSKWNDRLQLFAGDVRSFAFPGKYDFIISNPPFFEGDLSTSSDPKNLARHSKELTLAALMAAIDANLESTGHFGVLLPYHRMAYFEALAAVHHFCVVEKLLVRQTPGHDYFRAILHFARSHEGSEFGEDGAVKPANLLAIPERGPMVPVKLPKTPESLSKIPETTLIIRNDQEQYTAEFTTLLKDYYLYL